MSNRPSTPPAISADPLGDYVACASRLHGKFATIVAHQQESAASLSRAAAHLRSMGELGRSRLSPESRNFSPTSENPAKANF
ncbi:MAG: hypothetical protein CVU34_10820 [Betaproteobacteria bacterium HGW-Betaproteobacteria-7]|jgi:hypothetical protein|nr:MAG: hypothetical protein CVU34_10820 [Betaproteobacteria bacterium HGW-Betaproteobacteria-7]